MEMNEITSRIRKAYDQGCRTHGDAMSIVRIAEQMDVTPAQMTEAMIELARTGEWLLVPESNQMALTEWDRIYAVRHGGQDKHLIMAA